MKLLLLVLLTGHILGDYYFQGDGIARRKDTDPKALWQHCLRYGLPFALLALLVGRDGGIVAGFALAVLIHGIIDFGKAALFRRQRRGEGAPRRSGQIYLWDQGLHWLSLILLAYFFRGQAGALALPLIFRGILKELAVPGPLVLQWALALLLIYRPSNITFQKLFSMYKPQPEEGGMELLPSGSGQEKLRTGGIIGALEKLIALIFLASGEFMAIGLVLTAKSIARYDRISKSASFAEYYLIGTLASLIMVLLIHFLVFWLLAPLPAP